MGRVERAWVWELWTCLPAVTLVSCAAATFLPLFGIHEGRDLAGLQVANPTPPDRGLAHGRGSVSSGGRSILICKLEAHRIVERIGDDVCKASGT